MAYQTIRRNATKKIASLLAACPLITECRIEDMGGANGRVTAEQVLECGRMFEFDRVYECDGYIRVVIHGNWFFTAYKSVEAAKSNMTDIAQRKYGLI